MKDFLLVVQVASIKARGDVCELVHDGLDLFPGSCDGAVASYALRVPSSLSPPRSRRPRGDGGARVDGGPVLGQLPIAVRDLGRSVVVGAHRRAAGLGLPLAACLRPRSRARRSAKARLRDSARVAAAALFLRRHSSVAAAHGASNKTEWRWED